MILLRAKNIDFEVTYINLRDKPDWFLKISPHGKVPVLQVDGVPLFESNAIAEYLDETVAPRLHPEDPLQRARHRAWTDFVPDFSSALNKISYSSTREEMEAGLAAAPAKIARVEQALQTHKEPGGPYFGGDKLCLVDAAYAPFLQRFSLVEQILQTGLLKQFPLVQQWSNDLLANPIVAGAVPDVFLREYDKNMERRNTWAWQLKQAASIAAK